MSKTFTDWLRFQRHAQSNGFDTLKFMAVFPAGPMNCRWLDAYFGFIVIEGINGFITVDQLEEQYPGIPCIVLEEDSEAA